eukprot:282743-Rhodomonas_salina.4
MSGDSCARVEHWSSAANTDTAAPVHSAVARQAPSRSCTPRRVTSPAVRNGARASTGERV